MITYSFTLSFLSLIICGHAIAGKVSNNHLGSGFAIKKTLPVAIENKSNGQTDCYTINHRTRFPLSITQSSALTENNASSILYYSYRDIVTARAVEKVLKDHLLHLFPSHYFW